MPTCTTHIGRMIAIGLAKETTPGTVVDPTVWIPVETAEVSPVIKTVEDTSGYGILDEVADSIPVENTSETSLTGIARDGSIGHILMACFGTSSVPTLVETGVYKHDFSRKNDNCPITYTFTEDGPAGTKQAPYSTLDSLTIEAKAGDYVRFSVKYVGGQIVTITDKNPSYLQEKLFMASGLALTMADDVAGLATGTAVKAQSFKITIEKNLEMYMALGSSNVESIHNTIFRVKGDMELKYDSDTYLQIVTTGAKKAFKMIASSNVLIGATKKAEIGAILPRVAISEWKRSNDANKIVTQTLGFSGTFSVAEAKTIAMWLQNSTSSQY